VALLSKGLRKNQTVDVVNNLLWVLINKRL
jgi:hypothetical protein